MARIDNLTNFLTDIATAIKSKTGKTEAITPSNFDTEINSIEAGGGDIEEYFVNNISGSQIGIAGLIKKLPNLNITGLKDCSSMFSNCINLEEIPMLDTSLTTSFTGMFQYCSKIKTVPQYNTDNITSYSSTFYRCTALEYFPEFNYSKATRIDNICGYCSSLKEVKNMNSIVNTSFYASFRSCSKLESIGELRGDACKELTYAFTGCSALTNFGGIKNLGMAYLTTQSADYNNYKLDLSSCSKLTHDSLMNVINGLYDIASLGVQTQKLDLHANSIALLTPEEIAIATSKGWTVA